MTEVVPVTFVSSHAQPGGAERYLEALFEKVEPGWVAGVVCLQDGPLVARLRDRGVPTAVLETGPGPLSIARSAFRLRRLLRRERPSVVHANGVKAALVSVLATRIPVIWVKHDFSWDGTLARLIARRCQAVVGVSEAVVETFGSRQNVSVVHNGVRQRSGDRTLSGRDLVVDALGLRGDARVIGLVGPLDWHKGQHELVAVLPEVSRCVPGSHVVFVGPEHSARAEYADALRSELEREGLSKAVSFLGYREDALELMSGFDVLVVPSVTDARGFGREGFGYAGLEAFSVGTPVVAYDDGALREVLGDCALLVTAGDRKALAEGLVRVLEDAELRKTMVSCGLSRLEGRFSVQAMVEAMKERYRAAASRQEASATVPRDEDEGPAR